MTTRRTSKALAATATAALIWTIRRKPTESSGYRDTPFWRTYDQLSEAIDHRVGWQNLPTPAGLLVLIGLRNVLRQQNLHDTTAERSIASLPVAPFKPDYLVSRTPDGTYNDLDHPTMGAVQTRFGRNVPIDETRPDPLPAFMEPNPRTVSRELLTRHEFIPATSLNMLAAAWIQFMVKDWFSHGQGDPAHHWPVPVADDDPWYEHPMQILKTVPDPTADPASPAPPTFVNTETHWWDTSQIYGTTPELAALRRTHTNGYLLIGEDGRLVLPDDPRINPAVVPGWWLGLDMMATLFVLEHNAVCDRLRFAYPNWTDEELYQRARLVISALVAKIHTVEWTPAIIAHPTTIAALRANWWGIAGEQIRKAFGRISNSEVISGIPGSATEDYGVPYSLTEEFTIVYRMHPLIPDDYQFRSATDDSELLATDFRHIAGTHAQEITAEHDLGDLFYSFGTCHPGALVLNNFPKFLQEFQRPDNEDVYMDLASIDILRAREFGVPRYNQFRRLLHLKPAASFEDLAGDAKLAAKLSAIYGGDIERVDVMIGMFAERPPKGFGFSDTAFRIFILMASRRLNSDRFFTRDFNPIVYTPEGYDWVQNNSMSTVLLRHYPQLRPAMGGVTNAFQPWHRVSPH